MYIYLFNQTRPGHNNNKSINGWRAGWMRWARDFYLTPWRFTSIYTGWDQQQQSEAAAIASIWWCSRIEDVGFGVKVDKKQIQVREFGSHMYFFLLSVKWGGFCVARRWWLPIIVDLHHSRHSTRVEVVFWVEGGWGHFEFSSQILTVYNAHLKFTFVAQVGVQGLYSPIQSHADPVKCHGSYTFNECTHKA